jgi:hypothetical protein
LTRTIAPSLRALLTNLVDYAGLFPPAALSLPAASDNYNRYVRSEEAWMLGRFVIPAAQVSQLQDAAGWRISVLTDTDAPGWIPQIESLETKVVVKLSKPTYCEIPVDNLRALNDIQHQGAFAKVRTGGLVPDAIPASLAIARFLRACASLRLPFKATAGLHHPLRSEQPLTYAANPPCATMHGFVNVFLAAAFAWHGAEVTQVAALLDETDPGAFHFDETARWRDASLTLQQITDARRHFAHNFGSCSFEEPVTDLRRLGWTA